MSLPPHRFDYAPITQRPIIKWPNNTRVAFWEADCFARMIKDQFDVLYREGADSGRVMCLSLHPHNIGRPNATKYLDEALRYILGHDGVWNTTAADIAEYHMANYYDTVTSWIAAQKSGS